MNPAFSVQGYTLLQANPFSILPGHLGGDSSKYVVKDSGGRPFLWVLDMNQPGSQATSLLVKDAGQIDQLRVSVTGATPGISLQNGMGNLIGYVSPSIKPIKDHKKDKYDKDQKDKRQIILNDPMNKPLLTMSGKGAKRGDGNVEMKIKSTVSSKDPLKAKDKDKKDKDKKDKDKKHKDEKKDKDKKGKEVGEVMGSVTTGFHVKLNQSTLTLQERINIVGLLIAYMELERKGMSPGMNYPIGVPNQQGGYPYAVQQNQFPPGQMGMGQHSQPGFGFVQTPHGAPSPYQGQGQYPVQFPHQGQAQYPGTFPPQGQGSSPFPHQGQVPASFPQQGQGAAPFPHQGQAQGQHFHQPNY